MRTFPSWQEVYGGDLPNSMPAVPKVEYPYIPNPSCPEHCSGRHEHDGDVVCEHCKVPGYQVWQHEWKGRAGIYFSVLQPVNGMPPYVKGQMTNVTCIACGNRMRRG